MKKNRKGANSPFKPDDHSLLNSAHEIVSELRDLCDELVEGHWSELSAEDQVKLLGLADAARGAHWVGVGVDNDDAMRKFFLEQGPKLRHARVTEDLMRRLESGGELVTDADGRLFVERTQ